jgi:hypothetical protein
MFWPEFQFQVVFTNQLGGVGGLGFWEASKMRWEGRGMEGDITSHQCRLLICSVLDLRLRPLADLI